MKELNLKNLIKPEAYQTGISRKVRTEALNLARQYNGKFLDVCCGNGLLMLEYCAEHPDADFIGIDLDETGLQNARLLFRDNNLADDCFVKGNAFSMPWKDTSFNAVFSLNTLMNFHPKWIQKLFHEISRITKPGAKVVIDFRNAWNPIFFAKFSFSRITNRLTVFSHTYIALRPFIKESGFKLNKLIPIGGKCRFTTAAYIMELEKKI